MSGPAGAPVSLFAPFAQDCTCLYAAPAPPARIAGVPLRLARIEQADGTVCFGLPPRGVWLVPGRVFRNGAGTGALMIQTAFGIGVTEAGAQWTDEARVWEGMRRLVAHRVGSGPGNDVCLRLHFGDCPVCPAPAIAPLAWPRVETPSPFGGDFQAQLRSYHTYGSTLRSQITLPPLTHGL